MCGVLNNLVPLVRASITDMSRDWGEGWGRGRGMFLEHPLRICPGFGILFYGDISRFSLYSGLISYYPLVYCVQFVV